VSQRRRQHQKLIEESKNFLKQSQQLYRREDPSPVHNPWAMDSMAAASNGVFYQAEENNTKVEQVKTKSTLSS